MTTKPIANSAAAHMMRPTAPKRARKRPALNGSERRREGRCRDHQAAGPCFEAEVLLEVHRQGGEEEPEYEEEDHEADADRAEHRRLPSDPSETARLCSHSDDLTFGSSSRQAPPHPRRGDEADGVRSERQTPAAELGECSANGWEHRQRDRQHGRVLTDAAGALESGPVIAYQHNGEVDQAGGAHALQQTAEEEDLEGRCRGGEHAKGGEDAQARHQHGAPPEAVGQHAYCGRHDDAGQSPGGHEQAGAGRWLVECVEDVGERRPDQRVGQDPRDGDREDEAEGRPRCRRDLVGRLRRGR